MELVGVASSTVKVSLHDDSASALRDAIAASVGNAPINRVADFLETLDDDVQCQFARGGLHAFEAGHVLKNERSGFDDAAEAHEV